MKQLNKQLKFKIMNTIKQATSRQTTNLLKKYIKKNFGQDVRVRSNSFAGGNSLHIYIANDDKRKEITDIAKNLEYGTFNGYEDIYENKKEYTPFTIDGFILETYKYVIVQQSY